MMGHLPRMEARGKPRSWQQNYLCERGRRTHCNYKSSRLILSVRQRPVGRNRGDSPAKLGTPDLAVASYVGADIISVPLGNRDGSFRVPRRARALAVGGKDT